MGETRWRGEALVAWVRMSSEALEGVAWVRISGERVSLGENLCKMC